MVDSKMYIHRKHSAPMQGLLEKRSRNDAEDVARARIRRENESPVLDILHAEIARGEMAIALGVWWKEWFY